MGLVGLRRLLDDEVKLTEFGVRFDTEVLKKLPNRFFEYMIQEHSIAERDYKSLTRRLDYAQNKAYFANTMKSICKTLKDQTDKVEKYYPNHPKIKNLKEIVGTAKDIKSNDRLDELKQLIEAYYQIMKVQKINDKLTINYFKAAILQSFFGQVSFLNVSKNKLTKEEQVNLFYTDYIKPVLLESQLLEMLNNNADTQKVLQFLDDEQKHKPFNKLLRSAKKAETLDDIRELVASLPQCSLIDGQFATVNYEEMIFSALGVSGKAQNFSWDFQSKQSVPLSALARVILFLAPLGAAFYNRKDGFEAQGEYRQYAGFVIANDPFYEIYQINNAYKQKKDKDLPFDEVVTGILLETKHKSRRLADDFMIIELFSDYRQKKTLLDYYHMPDYMIEYFTYSLKRLKAIHIKEYREEFTRQALRGIEPKEIIFKYLRAVIKHKASGVGGFIAAQELQRIRCLKRGVDMKAEDKTVYHVFMQGQKLRKAVIKNRESRAVEDDETYVASGTKKIYAIAYRLLNAAKASNRKGFLDTVYRMHMAAGEEISSVFLNVLHEKNLAFDTVASSFIAGLLSKSEPNKKEAESDE